MLQAQGTRSVNRGTRFCPVLLEISEMPFIPASDGRRRPIAAAVATEDALAINSANAVVSTTLAAEPTNTSEDT